MKRSCLILSVLLSILATELFAEPIRLAGDLWCPYNCDVNDEKPGFMVEVARAVFKTKGYTVEHKIMPWARASMFCQSGEIDGVIGVYRQDAPDFIFPKNELGMVTFGLFVLKDNPWTYNGISSLSQIKLGATLFSNYTKEINQYIDNHKKSKKVQLLGGKDPLKFFIKKLIKKPDRIDAILEAEQVFWYKALQMGEIGRFKTSGNFGKNLKTYIAFSPKVTQSKRYAKMLSKGIVTLRRNGTLNKILMKYGLSDWR